MSEAVEVQVDLLTQIGVLAHFELGDGLEIWKVPLKSIKEQDLNARAQTSGTFLQLSKTIEKQKRLESLPLCAVVGNHLELISGHHRTRAARKAGLEVIWVMVDVTGLTRDQIKAKQLAHNSIQGKDDPDILRKIFDSIEDVEARIEAFVEPNMEGLKVDVSLTTRDMDVFLESKTVVLLFLSAQEKLLKDTLNAMNADADQVYLATREEYDKLVETLAQMSETYEIRSTPTLFAKMCEIVQEHMAATQPIDEEQAVGGSDAQASE